MKYMRVFTVLMLTFSMTACALTKQQDKPEWGGSEEWRMKSLEESFLNFKEGMREQKNAMEKLSSDVEKRFDSVDSKLEKFESRLAEIGKNQEELMAARESGVMVPVDDTEVVVGGSESGEERPWMNVPGEDDAEVVVKEEVEVKTAPKPKTVSKPKTASKPSAGSPEAVYQEGVRLVMNDKPAESRTVLTKFLQTYPTSKLAPNALYWLGETYYSEKRYAQSILKFKEVGQRFPKANKVPDSLLKIGLAYDKLGDAENARFYLNTLISDYPKSNPASIARSRLKEIGG